MMRFVVFLKFCVMASATVPEHVMEMFENETLAVNETNETIVLILNTPTGPTSTGAPTTGTGTPTTATYTGTPTTLEPTFAPSEVGDTSAPTTLAPTPAPAPKARVEVTVQLASAGDFNLDAFVQQVSAGGDVADATFSVTYTLEMSMTIDADSLNVADVTSSMATLLGVDASIVTVVITPVARRLSDRRLAASEVTATAESSDASAIDAARARADAEIDPTSVVAQLRIIDETAYATAVVYDIVPAAVEAKVEIVQPTTDEAAGSTLANSIASSVEALSPASFGATGMDQPTTSVTIETAFPTMEPTTANTSAPTAEEDEENGATLERAGLLTVAMIALTTVVGMQ